MLFSGKQWETSSLGRAPRRSVNLAQVGVDKHAADLTKRWHQRRRGSQARETTKSAVNAQPARSGEIPDWQRRACFQRLGPLLKLARSYVPSLFDHWL